MQHLLLNQHNSNNNYIIIIIIENDKTVIQSLTTLIAELEMFINYYWYLKLLSFENI